MSSSLSYLRRFQPTLTDHMVSVSICTVWKMKRLLCKRLKSPRIWERTQFLQTPLLNSWKTIICTEGSIWLLIAALTMSSKEAILTVLWTSTTLNKWKIFSSRIRIRLNVWWPTLSFSTVNLVKSVAPKCMPPSERSIVAWICSGTLSYSIARYIY